MKWHTLQGCKFLKYEQNFTEKELTALKWKGLWRPDSRREAYESKPGNYVVDTVKFNLQVALKY